MNLYLAFLLLLAPVWAKRSLSATSLVTCMENSQISPSYFNVTFDPDSRALKYNLDLTTEISGNVTAHVQIYAYGFVIIDRNIDMCTLGWKQFCPLYPGSLQIESVEYISASYVRQVPGIAYTVPDIDAVVKVDVYDKTSGEKLSCLQSSFTNGKTVAQTGIKWATAVIAGLGLLMAALLSTFGNSNAAAHISTNSVSLFLYFQAVVVVSMQHVERVPPIASSWAENLAWSMGLIEVKFMQKIFRWYVQSTGGTPTLFFTGTTKQILVQRAKRYLRDLHDFVVNDRRILPGIKRSLDYSLSSNENLIVLRGIKRIGYNSHIEPTSIVVTGLTFFVLCGFFLVVIIYFVKLATVLLIRTKNMNPNRLSHFRKSSANIVKGSLLRYIYIGFTQVVILSLWEFTVRDSPAVIVIAAIALIMTVGVIAYSFWNTHKVGTRSRVKYSNPAALLYGDNAVLQKFGFCYTMFNAEKYWFGMVLISYALLKAIFIGLCQGSGKTSTIVLFVLDLAYTVFLFVKKPYMDKSSNILNCSVAVVITINSFLFMFFSDVFGQPASVGSIMGWVFFILNAAFSFLLLIMIIVLISLALVSKNPDARFAPAKDDRTSFQRKSSLKHKRSEKNLTSEANTQNELFALGAAAQDHLMNWESEMYKLNDMGRQTETSSSSQDRLNPLDVDDEKFDFYKHPDPNVDERSIEDAGKSFGEKLKSKMNRTFSTKSKGSPNEKVITRMSDTLSDDNVDSLPLSPDKSLLNHKRDHSVMSESAYSNYSNVNPTGRKDFV